MMRLTRLITVLTMLAAFMVGGFVPAVGSWSCPDGTACVFTVGHGMHCVGGGCQMPCCAAKKPANCCDGEHGDATAADIGHPAWVKTPHCRYHNAPHMAPVWVPAPAAP